MLTKQRNASLVPVIALAAMFTVTGCNGGGVFGNDARLRMVLSNESAAGVPALGDSDDDEHHGGPRLSSSFQSARVTLSSVLVRNLDGQLIDVDFDLPVTVDVVQIEGGKQVVLPDGGVPAGSYDQVVIVITAVEGTTKDGTVITIEPPGGGWTAVVPICELDVAEGSIETVDITLNVRNSFLQQGPRWGFQPRFLARHSCAGDQP